MGAHRQNSRRRGVRASRAKLYKALTDAGLKTQAGLAERIADLENLDVPPKDVVNRVFRELPVDLQTLERIARAMDTQAYTLYKSSDEPEIEDLAPEATDANPEDVVSAEIPPQKQLSFVSTTLITMMLLVVLGAGYTGWWIFNNSNTTTEVSDSAPVLPGGLGRATLVVIPFAGDDQEKLTVAIREALSQDFNVAKDNISRMTDPEVLIKKLRPDVSLEGEIVTVGRLSGIRIYLHTHSMRQQIWSESLPIISLEARLPEIAHNTVLAVKQALGVPIPENRQMTHFPLAPVQDYYLEGRLHLDQPPSELNLKRAQSRFQAALRLDPNYALAHAGLCEALVEERWMEDEQRALIDASRVCGQALQLHPNDASVRVAHARFLRVTGQMEESIRIYEAVLANEPDNVDALTGLAETSFHLFRKNGDREILEKGITLARRAGELDSLAWKPLYTLAAMEMFSGDVVGAIATSKTALERNVNEYLLANMGTYYFCIGEFEKAHNKYLKAQEIAPQSYVGDEFLGKVYYFLGDFEKSVELRKRAIDSVAANGSPEIHEMWGNLADSYRQAGYTEEAMESYQRAAEIVERDFLRGTATMSDRAARAYYYTILRSLQPEITSGISIDDIDIELDTIYEELNEALPNLRLAQAWVHRGNLEKASMALERATTVCRGFASMPDLAHLQ